MPTHPLVLLRFPDLKRRGIAKSWTQLRRLEKHCGFPPGRMCGPQTRTWTEQEVDEWYFAQPVEGPKLRGAAARVKQDYLRRTAVELSDEKGPA
jgi:hypothetical protein